MVRATSLIVMAGAAASLALLSPAMAASSTFTYAPETHAPEWDATHPYSRNIFWDFSTNPQTTVDQSYYGRDDPVTGDAVSITDPDVLWNAGVIGTWDRNAGGPADFTIAAQPGPDPTYVWLELDAFTPNDGASFVSAYMTIPGPVRVIDSWGSGGTFQWMDNGAGGTSRNAWWKLDGTPELIELRLSFHTPYSTPAPHYAYADNVHVAITPEPDSVALVLLSGLVIGWGATRRRPPTPVRRPDPVS